MSILAIKIGEGSGPLRKPRARKSKIKKHHPWVPASLVYENPKSKPKSMLERFKNPIISVDIQTGRVTANRMDEFLGVSL